MGRQRSPAGESAGPHGGSGVGYGQGPMKVLVTGGAGYIGSHTCVELMQARHGVVIFDNLCNSHAAVVGRIAHITGRTPDFLKGDVRDRDSLRDAFARHRFDAVIHFAGLKAVGESVEKPIEYYDNNVQGALTLCGAMAQAGVRTLVFSSSATVYGDPSSVPIREDAPLAPTNPYGHSKLMVERILGDLAASDPTVWRMAVLRYFNPAGAHSSGLIGEDPQGIPNNLMPNLAQVAAGVRDKVRVFGSDYPTRDGTGVRDYIHVVDLARGHLAAMETMQRGRRGFTVNLGTRGGARFRARKRPTDSLRARRPPRGGCGRVLCGPIARREDARLEGGMRPRRHVSRCMEMAKHEPTRVPGGRRAIGCARVMSEKHRRK